MRLYERDGSLGGRLGAVQLGEQWAPGQALESCRWGLRGESSSKPWGIDVDRVPACHSTQPPYRQPSRFPEGREFDESAAVVHLHKALQEVVSRCVDGVGE